MAPSEDPDFLSKKQCGREFPQRQAAGLDSDEQNEGFLKKASSCFLSCQYSRELYACGLVDALSEMGNLDIQFDSGSNENREILDPVEICAHVLELYSIFHEQGEELAQILNYMKKDTKLGQIWAFLNDVDEGINPERLFVIFLFWVLRRDSRMERHSLRPVRFEIRDVDKAKFSRVINLLEEWVKLRRG